MKWVGAPNPSCCSRINYIFFPSSHFYWGCQPHIRGFRVCFLCYTGPINILQSLYSISHWALKSKTHGYYTNLYFPLQGHLQGHHQGQLICSSSGFHLYPSFYTQEFLFLLRSTRPLKQCVLYFVVFEGESFSFYIMILKKQKDYPYYQTKINNSKFYWKVNH